MLLRVTCYFLHFVLLSVIREGIRTDGKLSFRLSTFQVVSLLSWIFFSHFFFCEGELFPHIYITTIPPCFSVVLSQSKIALSTLLESSVFNVSSGFNFRLCQSFTHHVIACPMLFSPFRFVF